MLPNPEESHNRTSFQSAAYVVADFVYEFFNLCGSVHRLFSGYYGRSSPDHAVDRRCQSGWPLGTRRHGTAASTWTRWDRRRRKKTRHWWHSASNNDHNWSKSGRGASKVGWFICFINFATPKKEKKKQNKAPNASLLRCGPFNLTPQCTTIGWSGFNDNLTLRCIYCLAKL